MNASCPCINSGISDGGGGKYIISQHSRLDALVKNENERRMKAGFLQDQRRTGHARQGNWPSVCDQFPRMSGQAACDMIRPESNDGDLLENSFLVVFSGGLPVKERKFTKSAAISRGSGI